MYQHCLGLSILTIIVNNGNRADVGVDSDKVLNGARQWDKRHIKEFL